MDIDQPSNNESAETSQKSKSAVGVNQTAK